MRALIVAFLFVLGVGPLCADEFAATFRLRGGYDSNPLMIPQGKGSSLIAWDAASAYGHDHGEWIGGATAEASVVRYREEGFAPLQNYRLRFRLANKNQNDISFDATTAFTHFSAYDTKSEAVSQRVHLQWVGGVWRPFVSGDLRVASLNELNVLLGEFLPEPMRYLRGTIAPGLAFVKGDIETGFQLALSETKYQEEFDLFGFRRDNDRVQPAIYAKYSSDRITFAGALSYLRIYSQDIDFTDVKAILFEISLSATWKKWTGEFAIARTAEDTTFPVSPVTIKTASHMKISRALSERYAAALFARTLQREYWDSPFFLRTRVAGFELKRSFADDVALTAEIGFARSLLISGAQAEGMVATLALSRRFAGPIKK